MGCGPSENQNATGNFTTSTQKNQFVVKVEINNQVEVLQYEYQAFYLEMPLSALMNFLNFDQNQRNRMDANFVSQYDPNIGRFRYFVQRLSGKEMENENDPYSGKIWVPYLNGKAVDWDYACERDIPVKHDCEVLWKFETVEKPIPTNSDQIA